MKATKQNATPSTARKLSKKEQIAQEKLNQVAREKAALRTKSIQSDSLEIMQAFVSGKMCVARIMREAPDETYMLAVLNMLPNTPRANGDAIDDIYLSVKQQLQINSFEWLLPGKTIGRVGKGLSSVFSVKDKAQARTTKTATTTTPAVAPKLAEGASQLDLGKVEDSIVAKLNADITAKNQRIAELETSLLQLQAEHYRVRNYGITLTGLLAQANAQIADLKDRLSTQPAPVMLRRVK